MGHCRLLFVGGRANLEKVFEGCPDSSSESAAEMTIGADWVADWDWLSPQEKEYGRTTDDFTKANTELYQEILDGWWYECYDVRDPNHYGSFDCINCPDYEAYDGLNNTIGRTDADWDWEEKEKRNRARTIEAIKKLPEDTLFHFADSHW